MMPAPERLFEAIDATWPAAASVRVGPFRVQEGRGGGKRVSAAVAEGPATESDIQAAEAAMAELSQTPLFQIRPGDEALDASLGQMGYQVVDPVHVLAAPVAAIATELPPRVSTFCVWEPLAIQIDIWAGAGIGPARLDVMRRAKGPKTSILGRLRDSPAGTAFLAIHDDIAMLHALEVLPHQRRIGMGLLALRQAAFWAIDHGATHLAALTVADNAPADALFRSVGMVSAVRYHYRQKPEL